MVFEEEKPRNFALEIAKSFSEKGWLSLNILELSDKPVSALFGFRYRSKFYYYLAGFDPAYYRYSVGNLLLDQVIGQCIKDGLTEFDFMRGADEHKNRWNTSVRWNCQATLTRNGLMTSVRHQLYEEYWKQGKRFKFFLKIK